MGSDTIRQGTHAVMIISIHAPAWGATLHNRDLPDNLPFQSTLPHGERLYRVPPRASRSYFNPRSRMGSDHADLQQWALTLNFNPRSRMGSDRRRNNENSDQNHFNPRSRMGSDHSFHYLNALNGIFQSTLPHGERQLSENVLRGMTQFQSTLPHGERRCSHRRDSR